MAVQTAVVFKVCRFPCGTRVPNTAGAVVGRSWMRTGCYRLRLDLKQGKSSKLGIYQLPRGKILRVSSSVSTTNAIPERIFPSSVIFLIRGRQGPGESFDRYVTALRQIADKCAFDAITPDDLLRNLGEPKLNSAKTLNIGRASEMSQVQTKAVRELGPPNVHLLKENKKS